MPLSKCLEKIDFVTKENKEQLLKNAEALRSKGMSLEEAEATVKNTFVNAESKRLNAELNKLKKGLSIPQNTFTPIVLPDFTEINKKYLSPTTINIVAEIEKVKEKLKILNSNILIVNPNNSNEYIDSFGKIYDRVSTLIKKTGVFKKGDADRGTIIDSLLRDFISNNIISEKDLIEKYNKIDKGESLPFTGDMLSDLFMIFSEIKKTTNNLELISDIPTLWGVINGKNVAGTIDLLAIDKNTGKVFIIDLKTSTQNRRNVLGTYYDSYRESDSIQQSGYATLLKQRTDIDADITVLPIQVFKSGNEYVKATASKDRNDNYTMAVDRRTFEEKAIDEILPSYEDDAQFRIADNNSFVVNEESRILGEAWFNKNFPQIPIELVQEYITIQKSNEKAIGMFAEGLVKISKYANKSTYYHEAFHVAFNLFIPVEEQNNILDEASKLFNISRGTTQSTDKFLNELEQESEYYNSQSNDVKLEEKLAFGFETFKKNKENANFPSKILDFFKNLFAKIQSFLSGKENIRNLYNKIDNGYFSTKKVITTATGVNRMSIFNEKGKEVLNAVEANYFSDEADYHISKLLSTKEAKAKSVTIYGLNDPIIAKKIYESLERTFNRLLNTYKKSDKENKNAGKDEKYDKVEIILKNFNAFIKFHLNNSNLDVNIKDADALINSIEYIEKEEEEEVDLYSLQEGGDKKSVYQFASKPIRNLFRLLPNATWTKDGIIETVDEFGFHKMVDSVTLLNRVALHMAGESNETKFFEKLFSEATYKKIPELFYLKGLMKMPSYMQGAVRVPSEANFGLESASLYAEVFRTFSRPIVPLKVTKTISIKVGEEEFTRFIYIDAISSSEKIILQEWIDNFTVNTKANKYVEVNEQTFIKRVLKIPLINKLDVKEKDLLAFFDVIGIKLSQETVENEWENIRDNGLLLYDFYTDTQEVNGVLLTVLNDPAYNQNPLGYIYDKENPMENFVIRRVIKTLQKAEAKHTKIIQPIAYRNSEGELQSIISDANNLTKNAYEINNSENLDDLYERLPQLDNDLFRNSNIRKQLFDESGLRDTEFSIEIQNYNGINEEMTAKLDESDMLIMDVGNLTQNNIIQGPRTESKATYYALAIVNNKYPDSLPNGYLSADLENIVNFYEPHKAWMKKESSSNWGMFDFMTKEEHSDFNLGSFKIALERYVNVATSLFEKKIIDLFGDNSSFVKKIYIDERNETPRKIEDIDYRKIYRDFIIKNMVHDIEFNIMNSGNLAYYKDFTKRVARLASTGIPVNGLESTKQFLENSQIQTLAEIVNVNNIDVSKTSKTSVIPDVFSNENIVDNTVKNINKVNNVYGIKNSVDNNEKLKKERLSLNEANKADGQAYINIDAYRQFLLNTGGRWNKYMEATYEYEGLFYKKEILKRKLSEKETDRFLELEGLINKDDRYNLTILKYQLSGGIVNSERPAYDKMSLAPLLPSLIYRSKELLKVTDQSIKNGIAYVKHRSATKLQYTGDVNLLSDISKNITEVYSGDLKEQLKTDNDKDSLVIIGSQLRKLFFVTFFENGSANSEIESLYKNYKQALKNLIDINKIELFKELGIELEGNNIVVKNQAAFIEKLQKEADNLEMNVNVKDSLKVGMDGKLITPFEFSGITSVVNDLLFGLIDKTLRVQKVKGGQFTLLSNAYFDKLNFYDLEKINEKLYVKEADVRVGLVGEYKKLLNLQDEDNDNQPIGTLKRLNELLKDSKFIKKHKKSLTIIAYRIPTQEQNSMEILTIKEFLSPTVGWTIQAYDEITSKSGADFDIDKLFVLMPSLTRNGIYIDKEANKEIEKNKEELKSLLKSLKGNSAVRSSIYKSSGDLLSTMFGDIDIDSNAIYNEIEQQLIETFKELKSLDFSQKQMLENELNESMTSILKHPLQYERLTKPNSSSRIKDIARQNGIEMGFIKEEDLPVGGKLKLPQGMSILNYITGKLNMHKTMQGAQRALGVYAVGNVRTAILQQGIVEMNVKKVYVPLLTQKEFNTIVSNNKISLSGLYDVEGIAQLNINNTPLTNKNEINSELVTEAVDNPSNPTYFLLGIEYENLGVVQYLLTLNVPFDRIVDMLNTGIIRRYNLLKKSNPFIKFNDIAKSYGVTEEEEIKGLLNISNFRITPENLKQLKKDQFTDVRKTQLYKLMSLNILATYLHFNNKAQSFKDLTQNYSDDTKKITNTFQARAKRLMEKQIADLGVEKNGVPLFTADSINYLSKESVVSLFNNSELSIKISKAILPYFTDEETLNYFSEKVKSFVGTNSLKRTLAKRLFQEYMQFIVENMNVPFSSKGIIARSAFKGNAIQTFAAKLYFIKNNYPKSFERLTNTYSILNNIIIEKIKNEMPGEGFSRTDNYVVKLNLGGENIKSQENTYIKELNSLLSFNGFTGRPSNELKDKQSEFTKDVNDLIKSFTYLAFKQGGFSQNRFNITSLLPLSILIPEFELAFKNYQLLSSNKKLGLATNFYLEFYKFNPQFSVNRGKQDNVGLKDYYNGMAQAVINEKEVTSLNEVNPIKIDINKPEFNKLPFKSSIPTFTYAGIGSRETPANVLSQMTELAKELERRYTLNTGKTFPATESYDKKVYDERKKESEKLSKLHGNQVGLDEEGADRAFSAGTSKKNLFGVTGVIGNREMKVMEEIHPNPSALKSGGKKLMARNTNQIFGENLDTPVDFVLFYAEETSNPLRPKGGTGQAVEMARRKGIPTINMANPNWREELDKVLNTSNKVSQREYTPENITSLNEVNPKEIINRDNKYKFKENNKLFKNISYYSSGYSGKYANKYFIVGDTSLGQNSIGKNYPFLLIKINNNKRASVLEEQLLTVTGENNISIINNKNEIKKIIDDIRNNRILDDIHSDSDFGFDNMKDSNDGIVKIINNKIPNTIVLNTVNEVSNTQPKTELKVINRNPEIVNKLKEFESVTELYRYKNKLSEEQKVIYSQDFINREFEINNLNEVISPNEIYSQLGNKTKSENIKIIPWGVLKEEKKVFTNDGIVTTRIDTQNFMPGSSAQHFGNPFTSNKKLRYLIQTNSTKESVEKYINWIITGETGVYFFGENDVDPVDLDMQRDWIVSQLKSGKLKGEPLLYYKELGEPSHATALDYLINKYDWNNLLNSSQTNIDYIPVYQESNKEIPYSFYIDNISYSRNTNEDGSKYYVAAPFGSVNWEKIKVSNAITEEQFNEDYLKSLKVDEENKQLKLKKQVEKQAEIDYWDNTENNIVGKIFSFDVGENEKGLSYEHKILIKKLHLLENGNYEIIADNTVNGKTYHMITDSDGSVISYTRNGKTFDKVSSDEIFFLDDVIVIKKVKSDKKQIDYISKLQDVVVESSKDYLIQIPNEEQEGREKDFNNENSEHIGFSMEALKSTILSIQKYNLDLNKIIYKISEGSFVSLTDFFKEIGINVGSQDINPCQ